MKLNLIELNWIASLNHTLRWTLQIHFVDELQLVFLQILNCTLTMLTLRICHTTEEGNKSVKQNTSFLMFIWKGL